MEKCIGIGLVLGLRVSFRQALQKVLGTKDFQPAVQNPINACARPALTLALCAFMLCACQTPMPDQTEVLGTRTHRQTTHTFGSHFEGRLMIEIQSSPVKRISASFELDTDVNTGELRLLGPFGTTSALITWSQANALLQSSEMSPPTLLYPSLTALVKHWLGTELPLQNILRWLEGQDEQIPGWQLMDLGGNTKVALRMSGQANEPAVSIKMILNEASSP